MIIKNKPDIDSNQNMLEYLTEIMEDSHGFGVGGQLKVSILLCKMEEGRKIGQKPRHMPIKLKNLVP